MVLLIFFRGYFSEIESDSKHVHSFFHMYIVLLISRVTGACPVTTDLIMRVNVRTTTATVLHLQCGIRVGASIIQVLTRSSSRDTTLGRILRFMAGPARTLWELHADGNWNTACGK